MLASPLVWLLDIWPWAGSCAVTNGYRVEPHGPRPGAEAPNLANNKRPREREAVPNPARSRPRAWRRRPARPTPTRSGWPSRRSGRSSQLVKDDHERKLSNDPQRPLGPAGRALATVLGDVPRVRLRRPRNLDLGPNEIVALKHRVGPEIRSAFTDFKNQALRIQSIPGLGEAIDAGDAGRDRRASSTHWTIKPGEEAMPELVEPPPPVEPVRSARPARRFRVRRRHAPAAPRARPFPPGMPGPFPPGRR